MALPPGMSGIWLGGDVWRRSGIVIGLFPSTRRLPMSLAFTTVSSNAASSKWTTVLLNASTLSEVMTTQNLPLSTRRWFFKARHRASSGFGVSVGPYTAVVSAKPTTLNPVALSPTINAAKNVEVPGANILVSSANYPRVGSQNTTSYITKTVRYSAQGFRPRKDSFKFTCTSGGKFSVGTTATSGIYDMILPYSAGVTVVGAAFTGSRRSTAAEISKCNITHMTQLLTTAGSIPNEAILSTMTQTTGTAFLHTVTSTAFSQLMSSGDSLLAKLTLKTKTVGASPYASWVDVTYRMPRYTQTI